MTAFWRNLRGLVSRTVFLYGLRGDIQLASDMTYTEARCSKSMTLGVFQCTDHRFLSYHSCQTRVTSKLRNLQHVSSWFSPSRRYDTGKMCRGSHVAAQDNPLQDTVFTLSSGQGKSGVAVIRVSGPGASKACLTLTNTSRLPDPRKAILTRLCHPSDGVFIDKGIVLWFPGPHSFTGEDVCEFHVHGGPAVVTAVHVALDALDGFRHAEAGEFTKRAFMNQKLDLTEVEGLGDLINAETEAQRRQALRQMEGDLGHLYEGWRNRLIKCMAHVEAYIDFSEEENIEDGVLNQAQIGISKLLQDIQGHLNDNRCGERLRSGVQVAIVGRPNVGKSSLLNLLCQRPAAIVTPIAGTTRDVIESPINIGGYPVLVLDTAGLRDTCDVVELEGVRRARQRAEGADLTILMADSSDFIDDKPASLAFFHGNKAAFFEKKLRELGDLAFGSSEQSPVITSNDRDLQKEMIVVINKSDLINGSCYYPDLGTSLEAISRKLNTSLCIMSCKTGQGLENFLELLREKVEVLCGNPLVGNPSLTQARHRSNLMQCVTALQAFSGSDDLVMAAELLRVALRHLGKITGQVGVEEVLDVVFQDFCIGK